MYLVKGIFRHQVAVGIADRIIYFQIEDILIVGHGCQRLVPFINSGIVEHLIRTALFTAYTHDALYENNGLRLQLAYPVHGVGINGKEALRCPSSQLIDSQHYIDLLKLLL